VLLRFPPISASISGLAGSRCLRPYTLWPIQPSFSPRSVYTRKHPQHRPPFGRPRMRQAAAARQPRFPDFPISACAHFAISPFPQSRFPSFLLQFPAISARRKLSRFPPRFPRFPAWREIQKVTLIHPLPNKIGRRPAFADRRPQRLSITPHTTRRSTAGCKKPVNVRFML